MSESLNTDDEAATFTAKHATSGASGERCWAEVYDSSGFGRFVRCTRNGKVTLADGSRWCGIHSPEAVARRKADHDARAAAISAKYARESATSRLNQMMLAALREIAAGHNDPRALAAEVLSLAPPEPQA